MRSRHDDTRERMHWLLLLACSKNESDSLDVVLAMEVLDNVILWNDGAAVFTPETLDAR